jgi:hypothetical protein
VFNRRHKAILFITVVMTGCALLAGATLNQAFGTLLLGCAFAWVVGSETTARTFRYLPKLPGKSWPWLEVPLLLLLAGGLLVPVAVWSNYGTFFVCASMAVVGLLFAPFNRIPTPKTWLKTLVWIAGAVLFFFGAVGATELSALATQNAGRIGSACVYGLVSLILGMLWLIRGWKLVLSGISRESLDETPPETNRGTGQSTTWLYFLLLAGVFLLTVVLGMQAFLAFTNLIAGPIADTASVSTTSNNPTSPLIGFMFLAWWPYAAWAAILKRRPNTTADNTNVHKRVTILLGAIFVVVLSVATTFGIQNGNDRLQTMKVKEGMAGFQDVANKIGAIKNRDLRTTSDYIEAYEEMEPLIAEFDAKLEIFRNVLSQARESNKNRGPFNIQRLYVGHEQEWLTWDDQMFDFLTRDSDVTKKQILVAKEMAALPEQSRVEYWNENFLPLVKTEDELRKKLAALKATQPKD